MSYTVAKYLRLSVDDVKTESISIENQRFLLDGFISAMEEPDIKVMEFVDNGYSGTNFERPAMQELLGLVSGGEVDCILVKDFSRFGRNMIDAGYFLQVVFPLYKTRFIAVTDAFDSADCQDDDGGLEVAIKLLVSEQYSRDLSRKIKSAKRSKAERGEFISEHCLFGYKKVGDKLEIDEPAAETVRIIFNMKKKGCGITEIATRLYKEKRPTPLEYRLNTETPACIWSLPVILDALSNEQYIGTYVAGKARALAVGSSRNIKLDESEWIKIPNHHPAIVSKAVFKAAQEPAAKQSEPVCKKKKHTSLRYREIVSPLNRKVICGCCNHSMKQSSTRNIAFHCSHTRVAPDEPCYRSKMLASTLSDIVFAKIKERMAAVASDADTIAGNPLPNEEYDSLISKKQDEKKALYERFVRGEIDAGCFKASKTAVDGDIERLALTQSAQKKLLSERTASKQLHKLAQSALKENELTAELADVLIEKVFVFPDGNVDIRWK